MGFLSRLMGDAEKHKWAEAGGAMRSIAYDPGLVGRLKEDHQELVRIFSAIKAAAGEGRFHLLPELLTSLKLSFQTHIMLENVKFYGYLQQHSVLDPNTADFIFDVRKEMDGNARSVVKFIHQHTVAVPTLDTLATFIAELDYIGSLLMWRLQLEESRLYSLYRPV